LGIVSALSAATAFRFAATRQQVDAHRNRLQAEWLARSGYELAVARVIADPEKLTGETVTLVPKSEVKISIRKDSGEKSTYRIESEARYPVGESATVVRTVRRTLKRIEGPKGVQIESVSNQP
jgi:hypothetical protein